MGKLAIIPRVIQRPGETGPLNITFKSNKDLTRHILGRMNFVEIVLLLFIVVLTILLKKKWWWHHRQSALPPGPSGYPLVGHLLHIVKNPHLKLSQWAYEYGKLFTIKLGLKNAVVLSDPQVLRDVFSQYPATWKFQTDTLKLISRGSYGVLNSEGSNWIELRKFCVRNLRTFGFGNRGAEPIILSEAQDLVNWIKENRKKSGDGSVILYDILKLSANNTLWTMVSGERLLLGNKEGEMNKLMNRYEKALQATVKSGLMFFPSLKYIAPSLSGFKEFDGVTSEIHQYIRKTFDAHRETYVEGSPRDLIDRYIEHLHNTKDSKSSFYGKLGETNSVSTIMELFVAGSETSATTINYMTIYLATKQSVQKKLRDEIDEVIGQTREPSLEDRNKMPYTEAVMLEIFRHSSIGPLGVMHQAEEDIHYADCTFPKGTILLPNIYHIHYDNTIWGDPQNFRPERFLEKGSENLKDALVPFQPGKRSCIGEPLVKDVVFLFMTKLVQNFYILPDPNISMETYYERDVGLLLTAGAHKLIFKNRN